MIAFLDAEYNIEDKRRTSHTDMSLIEIALVFIPSLKSEKETFTYHAYCKPFKNGGKIYPTITELTGITDSLIEAEGQETFDVVKQVLSLFEKYSPKHIYTWGDFDEFALKKNLALFPNISGKKAFLGKISDIQPKIRKSLDIKDSVSLKNAALICGIKPQGMHNAFDDALTLMKVAKNVREKKYSKEKAQNFNRYIKLRDEYNKLKIRLTKIEEMGESAESFAQMALKNESFPDFSDFTANTPRSFGDDRS
ncbi:MAG: hypothetical protein IJS61_04055 [Firmicutes bacterium]|nr:hypothetical protein [Bacillota bacterium]